MFTKSVKLMLYFHLCDGQQTSLRSPHIGQHAPLRAFFHSILSMHKLLFLAFTLIGQSGFLLCPSENGLWLPLF